MAQFNFKTVGKNIMKDGQDVLLITAGTVASRKFLDLSKLLPQMDPDNFLIKQQGWVKFLLGLLAAGMINDKTFKMLAYGVALEGAIKGLRTATMNAEGTSFFEAIGMGRQRMIGQNNSVVVQPTDEFPVSVAGNGRMGNNFDLTDAMQMDSLVTVAGPDMFEQRSKFL